MTNKKFGFHKTKSFAKGFWSFMKKLIALVVILFLLFQVYKINRYIDGQSTETGVSEIDVLSNDIREIREYLLLPTHSQGEETQEESLESAFYTFLGRYNEDKTLQEKKDKQTELLKEITEGPELELIVNSEDISAEFSELESMNPEYVLEVNGYQVLQFGVNPEQDLYLATPLDKTSLSNSEFASSMKEELSLGNVKALALKAEEIEANLNKLKGITEDAQISEELSSRTLTIQVQDTLLPDNTYEAQILKDDGAIALKIAYFPQDSIFYINNEYSVKSSDDFATYEELISGLRDYILNTEFSSLAEQQVENVLQELLVLANSASFQKSLKDTGLKPKNIKKSDEEYILPIVKIKGEETVFKIIIDRSDASLWIEEGDQREPLLEEFTTFGTDLITTHPGGEFNLLLAGKHGTLTDTMILTHINENTREITLLSIPRDLFWKDRKINSFYVYFGMEGLVKELERMTGQKIDGYALIDMYAFIDVVDYLGGIDVTLEEALADPTYKTFDDGRWGTLYYAAGTHHVNGVQALRIARSRHTSSDFSRAQRQHLIIEAFKDKANSMKFQNPKKMFDLANTLLEKVDTNITASQGISYFFKYKDYEISGQHVLSTGNILVSDHLPTYQGKVLPEGSECNEDCVGMYILKPYAGWGSIPSYINNIFNS